MKRTIILLPGFAMLLSLGYGYMPGPNPEGKRIAAGWNVAPLVLHDSSHAYDIRFYGIDLNLPMTNSGMTAHERVTVTSRTTDLDSIAFHMNSLVCDSVKIGPTRLTTSTPSGLLVMTLHRNYQPGESLDLDIWYHRVAGTSLQGFYWYQRSSNTPHVLCYSTTEPSDARYWFPCFDEPWDKAEQGCAVNVTIPDSLSACANGLLDSVTNDPAAHTSTYWWREHYPISTYLVTFAASKWIMQKQWFHLSPTESTYVLNVIWREDSIAGVSAFAHNIDMVTFYSDSNRYGRYPFEKYGMVEAYPFMWGGMENQTMTMIHRQWVTYGDDNGIAHEMSHQWWGDMVTCQDWRNIWLNEGSATFSDELYAYHENGRSSFISLINSRASDYFAEEASDLHPIYDPPYPDHLFDWGHSYVKGGWVHRMLQFVEGDTVFAAPGLFYRALRAYGDSFKYGGATTDDYRRVHEQMTGLDLSWFFNEWVFQAGYPKYTINWHDVPNGPNYDVFIDIAQNNGSGVPTCFHMPLQVTIRMPSKDSTVTIPIANNPQSVSFTVSGNPSVLLANPGSWSLCQANVYLGIEGASASELARPLAASPSLLRNSVSIRYTLNSTGRTELSIIDAAGRKVRTLASGTLPPGTHYVAWNATNDRNERVAPGIYFCRLENGGRSEQMKLTVTE